MASARTTEVGKSSGCSPLSSGQRKSPQDTRWKRNYKRLSGYQFFLRSCLDELKERYPDHSIVLSMVSKMCAETWQKLGSKQKQRFQDEANFVTNNCIARSAAKKAAPVRLGPKRPLSAFILYCKENRQHVKSTTPGLTMGEISTVLSVMWKQCDPETKTKYKMLSGEQRDRYREEMNTKRKNKCVEAETLDRNNKTSAEQDLPENEDEQFVECLD